MSLRNGFEDASGGFVVLPSRSFGKLGTGGMGDSNAFDIRLVKEKRRERLFMDSLGLLSFLAVASFKSLDERNMDVALLLRNFLVVGLPPAGVEGICTSRSTISKSSTTESSPAGYGSVRAP